MLINYREIMHVLKGSVSLPFQETLESGSMEKLRVRGFISNFIEGQHAKIRDVKGLNTQWCKW